MLDLKALEKALSVIGDIGKGELTFTVNDIPVTMRVLTADEDFAVQRFARESAAEGDESEEQTLSLVERFKRATLSYAIVQVGAVNLRDVDFVATGDVTDKGVPVRVPRHVAVRKIIDGWAHTASLAMFQKYLELVHRADAAADKAVQFNPQDIDTEIARVERRLEELKKEKERTENVRKNPGASLVADLDRATQDRQRSVMAVAAEQEPPPARAPAAATPPSATLSDEPEPAQVEPEPEVVGAPVPSRMPAPPVVPVARQRVMPPVATPPAPPTSPPAPKAVTLPPNATPADGSFESMVDSFSDSSESIAAETARLQAARAAARRQALDATRQDATDILPSSQNRRVPPHRAAANVADAVMDSGAGSIESARPAGPVGGVETYRLAPATLTDRGRPPVTPGNRRVPVDETPKASPTNPRFKASGR